jgi:putative effector of murein hydrolase LrgA (UPF0299 family)
MNSSNQLNNNIMRRVYYAFGLRLATHAVTVHAVIFVGLGFLLTKLVFVERIYENLASREVAEFLPALVRILTQADVLTLAVFGLVVFTALSLPLRVVLPRRQPMQFA